MALETTLYDTADYLDTPQSVVYYLEAELEENEAPYTARAIATVARARGGFDRLAAETGISEDALKLSATKEEEVDRAMLTKMMEAFQRIVGASSKVA